MKILILLVLLTIDFQGFSQDFEGNQQPESLHTQPVGFHVNDLPSFHTLRETGLTTAFRFSPGKKNKMLMNTKWPAPFFGHRRSNSALGIAVKVVAFVVLMGLTVCYLKDMR